MEDRGRTVAEVSCTAAQLSGGRRGGTSLSLPFAAMQTAVKVMPAWSHRQASSLRDD